MFKFVENEAKPTKYISPTKPWGIAQKIRPIKNAPPTLSHGEWRWGKRLKTM
jgi:hypothetical protein